MCHLIQNNLFSLQRNDNIRIKCGSFTTVIRVFLGQNLLVDLRGFFSDLGSEAKKKPSKNGHLTGHFQSLFYFSFLDILRAHSKTSKVNQQSVVNISIFHNFP